MDEFACASLKSTRYFIQMRLNKNVSTEGFYNELRGTMNAVRIEAGAKRKRDIIIIHMIRWFHYFY